MRRESPLTTDEIVMNKPGASSADQAGETPSQQLDRLFTKRDFESDDEELSNLIEIQKVLDQPPQPQPAKPVLADVASGWWQIIRDLFGIGQQGSGTHHQPHRGKRSQPPTPGSSSHH